MALSNKFYWVKTKTIKKSLISKFHKMKILDKLTTPGVHKTYLKITAIVIAVFGPVFSLGTMDSTLEPARFTLDLLSWPVDHLTTYSSPDTRFLSALTGGFLFGWGIMIWCLSGKLFDIAPNLVRKAVLTGILSWFVLDSTGSITSGNVSNVFFNVFVLLSLAGPFWFRIRTE
jgi:hypothetical protein